MSAITWLEDKTYGYVPANLQRKHQHLSSPALFLYKIIKFCFGLKDVDPSPNRFATGEGRDSAVPSVSRGSGVRISASVLSGRKS